MYYQAQNPDLPQVSSIHDTTQEEMREITTTGALDAGERAINELRKRKLVIQK